MVRVVFQQPGEVSKPVRSWKFARIGLLSLFISIVAVVGVAIATWPSTTVQPVKKKPFMQVSLHDYRGAQRSLAEFVGRPAVVVAFLGAECPVAEKYASRLAEFHWEFKPLGVQFVAINSNRQDSLADIAAQVKRTGIEFPVLKDPDNKVADLFEVRRTPEVLVFDASRELRYRGRVDDQYMPGVTRPAPTRNDLRIALFQLLRGAAVSTPETEALGCLIGRSYRSEAKGDVTYSNQIARILEKRCVECHREGEVAPFPLTSYEEVVGWGDMISEVVNDGRMPPWFADPKHGKFANDPRLTPEEKDLVAKWVKGGMPEGDPADLPVRQQWPDAWRIPPPDVVIPMSETAFEVPAFGPIEYEYFDVPTNFTKDMWVEAAEIHRGNPRIIHHILVAVLPPGRTMLQTYKELTARFLRTPGMRPEVYLPGGAMMIPAGATLRFQVHYVPNGRAQLDQSSLGLKFIDPGKVRHRVYSAVVGRTDFSIPPRVSDYKVTAEVTMPEDVYLTDMMPHMHLRGKSFRYIANYSDGTTETLLEVPRYDFNWQLSYRLAEPKLLPAGTVIRGEAIYDNSSDNPVNPDPNHTVKFGEQTTDEMIFGYFTVFAAKEEKMASLEIE